ncbi:MAG: DMT family transporter [Armatimonadetes bacterium]|nr:DMT family transporter [Armatimonadota bacterium]
MVASLNRRMTPAAALLALLVFGLWGANNLAIKISVEAVPPLAAAALRFLQALGIMALWAAVHRTSLRPRREELRELVLLALAFTLQIAALNVGQKHTSAVRGTVFLAAHPLFVGLFAGIFIPGDPLRGRRLAGLGLAFAGILLTFAEGFLAGGGLLGDGIVLGSALLLGARLVMLKLIVQRVPVTRTLFWQFLLALPLFALGSLLFERGDWGPVTARHIGALAYQGLVVAGFCFAGNAWLYAHFRASQVAAFTFTTPLWGVLLCGLLAHDPITPWLLAGVACVTAGIALASRA